MANAGYVQMFMMHGGYSGGEPLGEFWTLTSKGMARVGNDIRMQSLPASAELRASVGVRNLVNFDFVLSCPELVQVDALTLAGDSTKLTSAGGGALPNSVVVLRQAARLRGERLTYEALTDNGRSPTSTSKKEAPKMTPGS
jgi:hypothetical protein